MRGKVIEMRKTKFWLFQIVMLVMLSLLFGSPVFAGPPDHAKGKKGAEMSNTALTNHASGGNVHAMDVANENAAFMGVSTEGGSGGVVVDPTECPDGTLDINGDGSECLPLFSF